MKPGKKVEILWGKFSTLLKSRQIRCADTKFACKGFLQQAAGFPQ
ncbi:hypothetical protein CAter282_3760 [Collimonas arenae]|uniref:Uncharacterized protein n=1 Tax=Collimonas arenae TaxID=279058 RepID=A0A127QMX7_9BURK|nr:hypothetical protein CAter10_4108 [Collimonas arenae]AMP11438.1 hypothetical protein CAter282_3760 [Collimonas arenae]